MITLYDFLRLAKGDYDTYDVFYDASVTVCYIDDEDDGDDYDKFCNEIIKRVNIVETHRDSLIVDWSRLIKCNMEEFKNFTAEHWICGYEDDIDEFIYQWIKEIHYYIAGYVSDDFYKHLINLVSKLK